MGPALMIAQRVLGGRDGSHVPSRLDCICIAAGVTPAGKSGGTSAGVRDERAVAEEEKNKASPIGGFRAGGPSWL